ncbi:MAG TPA: hypothetical protein VEX18_09840 [Polyangiaceae bacterium]|nr:hypothetical protein [Polyangiaceae bacterium]
MIGPLAALAWLWLDLAQAAPAEAPDTWGFTPPAEAVTGPRCASVPPLTPEGSAPPAPPHLMLGEDLDVPGDRPLYWLPGNPGDRRVIVYLHGMCGDVAAADYFREAARAHGSLVALRADTHCHGDRYKWRDDPPKVLERIRAGVKRINEAHGLELTLDGALLFGYSQGADRAGKLAAAYPRLFPRIVLGGTPVKASPAKLARAKRVAFLGGELESTATMRAGHDALAAAGIPTRFFTLECAYHGYYGIDAEAQLAEVLAWVSASAP